MTLDDLKARIPAFAKDVKLNLSNLVSDESLEPTRKWGLALACALATRNPDVAGAFDAAASAHLTPAARDAARAAASIMAMNNVYYRFLHLASNAAYQTMPARLRMTVIANPGVDKVDFELWALAVSAINGCGLCIDSHEKVLTEAGVTADVIQTAVRFAAIIQSVAVALEAGDLPGLAAAE